MNGNMKTIQELGDTTTTDVRGDAYSGYVLEPAEWEKDIILGAQKAHFFTQTAYEANASKGVKDIVVPKELVADISTWQASAAEGADVLYSDLDNLNGITITPADTNYGVAISNRAIRVNAVDLLKTAKNILTYKAGEVVDIGVATALAAATESTSSARGAQTIYGGDARAESELAAGDKFTVDMIADAKTKLSSTICKYWVPSSPAAEASSSQAKNPWTNTPQEPFVLYVAPEQENILLKDSQFVNAAEYGAREVILTGEVGKYLGIKIVVSPNIPVITSGGTAHDGGSAPGATGHRCMLLKARKSHAIGWGQKPKLQVFDFPSQLEQRLVMEMAYQAKVLYEDALVFIDVTDA